MKYLTKEWREMYDRILLANNVKSFGSKECLTDYAYETLYKSMCEKSKKEFINEFRNDPRFESGSLSWSDKYAEENYEAYLENRQKVIDSFPEELKNKLENFKCILLGYCTNEEKIILHNYAREWVKEYEMLGKLAINETDEASDYLPEFIELDDYKEEFIYNIEEENNDIIINFGTDVLRLVNAQVIRNDNYEIKPWNEDDPHSEWTRVVGLELHTLENNEFEIDFLLENRDDFERTDFWYFEVKCENIKKEDIINS